MLKIRLHRTGKTKRPHFRVVVAEHRRAAQGPYITILGDWDPLRGKFSVDEEKLKQWMDRGALPSDRLSRLLKKQGLKHKAIVIHQRPAKGPKKVEAAQPATPVAPTETTVEPKVEEKPAQKPQEVEAEQVEPAGKEQSEMKE